MVQNLSSAKPCAVFLEHRIFRIFGRRLHQKASIIGTCGTFIGWPCTCGWTRPQLCDRACSAVRGQPMNVWWASHVWWASFYTACRPTGNRGIWLAPRVKFHFYWWSKTSIFWFFTHLCWWGPNPFFPLERHGLVTLSYLLCRGDETMIQCDCVDNL